MDMKIVENSALFRGIEKDSIPDLLSRLGAHERAFGKGEYIYREGSRAPDAAIVLSGKVSIERTDAWGTRSIISETDMGGMFAEVYALVPDEIMPVDAVAAERSEILFIDIRRVPCSGCAALTENLLRLTASKTLILSRKISHTSHRTIRGRVLSYLSYMSAKTGSSCFDIPFSRQQLADYLGVERSALSGELGRMRNEGLIEFHRNSFKILGSEQI